VFSHRSVLPENLGRYLSHDGTQIRLRGLQLTSVPGQLRSLKNLRVIDLSENNLQTIPHWMGDFTELRSLDLSNNKLRRIPGKLGNLARLDTLDLSHNFLRKIPRQLSYLSRLTILNLSCNDLRTAPLRLKRPDRPMAVDLSHNRLRKLPPSAGQVPPHAATFLADHNRLRPIIRRAQPTMAGGPARAGHTQQVTTRTAAPAPAWPGEMLDRAWMRLRSLFVPSVSLAAVLAAEKADDPATAILQLYSWERDRLMTLAKGTAGAAITVLAGFIAAAVEGKAAGSRATLFPAAALVATLLIWGGFLLTGLRRLAEEYTAAVTLGR
jgi:Leucine-rich repeat (LRR) protein